MKQPLVHGGFGGAVVPSLLSPACTGGLGGCCSLPPIPSVHGGFGGLFPAIKSKDFQSHGIVRTKILYNGGLDF
ncbi:hypothetical protein A19Y_4654 [Planktothrix agardhii NIVA-CYA 126/8]|uniref:Uncharacterized protein n=1 Tax=Planktothrix agardhii (strain NIVA-CYA 126/8) TaxID=388467 RepID=A0A073CMA6_PLAA1|nr:hypothetical protein A19Y_4654 [Planktothrix agardhii NIVA-CYA 126/8]